MRPMEYAMFGVPAAYQPRAPSFSSVLSTSIIHSTTQGLRYWDLGQSCVYQLSFISRDLPAMNRTGAAGGGYFPALS